MTRLLEFVVALLMVLVLAVIVGLFLPSHAHIERSIEISHSPRHIYDVVNNFRRFPDYAGGALATSDPGVKFTQSGPAYGPGATISWTGNELIGDGSLVNQRGSIDVTNASSVTWDLTNNWRGKHKTFTIDVTPRGGQRVSTVTWSYDVDYGWNLINRYSRLWIHGDPAMLIQYGLDSMQTMLAAIPNVDYSELHPGLYHVSATPVLLVSTKAPRTLVEIDAARAAALAEIQTAMKKLGVKQAGPTTTIATEWGDVTYVFDVAVPIDATSLSIDGSSHDLTQLPPPPTMASLNAAPAASAASAGLPASAASAGAVPGDQPGSLDASNRLIVNANVRAVMLPESDVLEAGWVGEVGVALARMALKAYAGTHGYAFDDNTYRLYDQLTSLPTVPNQDQSFRVFLPVQSAPAQTPEQISGETQPLAALDPVIWSGETPEADKQK